MQRLRAPSVPWSITTAVVLVLVGAAGALKAGSVGASFMYDLEVDRPALAEVPPVILPAAGPPLARRVFIVIVDGLRLDVSYELPYLSELRRSGADGLATASYPTLSTPGFTTIFTGVPPSASGVRTNWHTSPVMLDSIMDRARAAGLRTGYASDSDALPRLFTAPRQGTATPAREELQAMESDAPEAASRLVEAQLHGDFDDARYTPWPGGFVDAGQALVAGGAPLVVLLLGIVDVEGHAHGGASPQYREAAHTADRALRQILSGLDLEQDAVVVIADHGHTNRGGHGGLEPVVVEVPLILAGAGIRHGGAQVAGRLMDVAPTVAALLGLPAPGHGLGRALTDALAVSPAVAQLASRLDSARVARNQTVVTSAETVARGQRLEKRAWRLALILGGALAALLVGLALVARGGLRLDVRVLSVGVPAFFIVYYMLIGILGQRFSPSLIPLRGHITGELLKYGLIGTAVHILAGWRALRHRHTVAERMAAANGVAWCGLVIAMLSAGLFWAYFPPPYVLVPTPRMLVLIPAVQVAVACYALGVALTQLVEVIVFVARAMDPRVRRARRERARQRPRRWRGFRRGVEIRDVAAEAVAPESASGTRGG